jgi:hypothetical protein
VNKSAAISSKRRQGVVLFFGFVIANSVSDIYMCCYVATGAVAICTSVPSVSFLQPSLLPSLLAVSVASPLNIVATFDVALVACVAVYALVAFAFKIFDSTVPAVSLLVDLTEFVLCDTCLTDDVGKTARFPSCELNVDAIVAL